MARWRPPPPLHASAFRQDRHHRRRRARRPKPCDAAERGAATRCLVAIDKHAANLATLRRLHPQVRTVHADLAEPGAWEQVFEGADYRGAAPCPDLGQDVSGVRAQQHRGDASRAARPQGIAVCLPDPCQLVGGPFGRPTIDYMRSKTAQEKMVRASGLRHCVLRPTLMFGWFDPKHLGWLARFMERVPRISDPR